MVLYRWYKVNYSKAGILVWGRGDGCGYTAGSCGGYIQSKQQQYIYTLHVLSVVYSIIGTSQ